MDPETLAIAPHGYGIGKLSIFWLLREHIVFARWISVAILILIIIGWRPRITGLLHWWVSLGLATSAVSIDGGDLAAANITLLLLPVTFLDRRKWHWEVPQKVTSTEDKIAAIAARFAFLAVRIQVAGIYFHSVITKLNVPEWIDGTAVYYFFNDPIYGMAPIMRRLMAPFLINKYSVSAITWGALCLELLLFMALTMPRKAWKPLLVVGICFHLAIALVHGLPSFSITMCAALILYLRSPQPEIRVLHDLTAR